MWRAGQPQLTAEQELLVWRAKGKRGVQATLEKHCDDLAELRKRVEELKISLAEKVAEKRAEVQRLQEEAKAQVRCAEGMRPGAAGGGGASLATWCCVDLAVC